jgi:molybdopterin/thiamine biosynthesis adenylyltransferase
VDIVDSELFEGPNTARHVLGLKAVGTAKAAALAARLTADIPGIVVKGYLALASTWVATKCKPGMYDLVVDCTAESAVRTMLTHWRTRAFGKVPVVHAWIEPFCAAAHVILTQSAEPWPKDDPAERLVNAADFSDAKTRIDLPACSAGFHPYGAADVWQAAAFTTERVLAVVDDCNHVSTVWSWVRSKAFFDGLGVAVHLRAVVPTSGGRFDSVMLTRDYWTVLGSA